MTITVDDLRELYSYDPTTGEVWSRYYNRQLKDCGNVKGKRLRAYIIAWALHNGRMPLEGMVIDHKDRDRTNNKPDNLREVTQRQNMQNSVSRSTSGLKGVTWHKAGGKWRADIRDKSGYLRYLGSFDTKEEAYEAYLRASAQYHGQFANLGTKP